MPQKTARGDPTPHTPLKGSRRHEVAKVRVWHVQTRPVVPPSLLRRCAGRSRPSLRCMMGLGAWAPANRATLAVSVQGWSVCPANREYREPILDHVSADVCHPSHEECPAIVHSLCYNHDTALLPVERALHGSGECLAWHALLHFKPTRPGHPSRGGSMTLTIELTPPQKAQLP